MRSKILDKVRSGSILRLALKTESLKALCDELDIKEVEQKSVIQIMEYLFELNAEQKIDRRSIIHPDKFDIYFDNSLNTQGILFKDFTPILERPWKEIKEKFDSWRVEKKESYLIDILRNVDAYTSKERFEKVTKLWILLVNNRFQPDYILPEWIDSVSRNRDKMNKFYGSNSNFFSDIIRNTTYECFFFDTYVIRLLLRKYIDNPDFYFPISKTELQKHSLERLSRFIETRIEFDVRVFTLFYYNCWSEKGQGDKVIILEEANSIIGKYIERYPKEYLRYTIRPKFSPQIDGEYVFEPFTPQYFKNWDSFEEFLNKYALIDEEFKPMLGFFAEFKKSNYTSFYSEYLIPWIEINQNTSNTEFKYFKHQTLEAYLDEMNSRLSNIIQEK